MCMGIMATTREVIVGNRSDVWLTRKVRRKLCSLCGIDRYFCGLMKGWEYEESKTVISEAVKPEEIGQEEDEENAGGNIEDEVHELDGDGDRHES